jgi:hypothetical protein
MVYFIDKLIRMILKIKTISKQYFCKGVVI